MYYFFYLPPSLDVISARSFFLSLSSSLDSTFGCLISLAGRCNIREVEKLITARAGRVDQSSHARLHGTRAECNFLPPHESQSACQTCDERLDERAMYGSLHYSRWRNGFMSTAVEMRVRIRHTHARTHVRMHAFAT